MSLKSLFYIGTYTQEIVHGTGHVINGGGQGIYLLSLDTERGEVTGATLVAESDNPSYLCVSGDKRFLYAVNELKEYDGKAQGSVSAYKIGDDGKALSFLDCKPTGGTDPCHVAISHDGRSLIVSNFMSGSVCAYRVAPDGSLTEAQWIQHQGKGPEPLRQSGPHAHSATFDREDRYVYVTDLGIDEIKIYELNKSDGSLCEAGVCAAEPGDGPRYCEIHPHFDSVLCIHELSCNLSSYRIAGSGLTHLHTVSMLEGSDQPSIGAALHITPDGRFAYCSARGSDCIVGFRLHGDGSLEPVSKTPSGGKTPRDFTIDKSGRYLLAANQDSDCVAVFSIDGKTGRLSEACRYPMPTPVCICPL